MVGIHHHVTSINALIEFSWCVFPAAQIEITLALAHEFNHAFAFDLGAQEIFVGINIRGIIGYSTTYTYGMYAFLYLGNVTTDVVSGCFVP